VAFFEAVAICFLKYAAFSGRASRSEYWNFVLFLVIALIGVDVLDSALFSGQVSGSINGFQVKTSGPLSTNSSALVRTMPGPVGAASSVSATVLPLRQIRKAGIWS